MKPVQSVLENEERFDPETPIAEEMPQNDGSFGDEPSLPADEIALANVTIGSDARIVGVFDTNLNDVAPALGSGHR